MKRKLVTMLPLLCVFALASCGSTKKPSSNNSNPTTKSNDIISQLLEIKTYTLPSKQSVLEKLTDTYSVGVHYGTKSETGGVYSWSKQSVTKVKPDLNYIQSASGSTVNYQLQADGRTYKYENTPKVFTGFELSTTEITDTGFQALMDLCGTPILYTKSEDATYEYNGLVRSCKHYSLDASLTAKKGSLKTDYYVDNETGIVLSYEYSGTTSGITVPKTEYMVTSLDVGTADLAGMPQIYILGCPTDTLSKNCYIDDVLDTELLEYRVIKTDNNFTSSGGVHNNTGFEGWYKDFSFNDAVKYVMSLYKADETYSGTTSTTKFANVGEMIASINEELEVFNIKFNYRTKALTTGSSARCEAYVEVEYSTDKVFRIKITDK